MGELGGRTRDQHLIIVFTKADRLVGLFRDQWSDIHTYLVDGSVDDMARTNGYIERMQSVSNRLYEFTEQKLQAHEFMNAAEANFKSVNFSIISALGTEPHGARLSVGIVPRRILDPVLWIMEKSFSGPERILRRWWGW